jgi:maleylacetate reductase
MNIRDGLAVQQESSAGLVETTNFPTGFARDTLPGRIVFGVGSFSSLDLELDLLGKRRAMVIASDRHLAAVDAAGRLPAERIALVWNEIRQHVPVALAQRATDAAVKGEVDVLVTIGGGSSTGLGKAVAVRAGLPLLSVPTTYSGSEMTPIYGLTESGVKKTARDVNALPRVVIYDPSLLASLPPEIVGPSGMNAFAHCAEALWAPKTDPITDLLALDGAARLKSHLRSAFLGKGDDSRGEVLVASCLAGVALGTVGTSLHHGLCHLLGGMFDTPHAETHAVLLPYVIEYLCPAIPLAIHRLSDATGSTPDQLSDRLLELARAVGAPHGLKSLGLTSAQARDVADAAFAKGVASPRTLELPGLRRLLDGAWRGTAPSDVF